jgi:O-antigen/teichoic acid export membrane protein
MSYRGLHLGPYPFFDARVSLQRPGEHVEALRLEKSDLFDAKLLRTVLPGSAVSSVAKISGVGFLFLMHVALARLLPDADQYGYVVWAVSLAQLLAVLAVLGLSQTALRFGSRYLARGEHGRYLSLVRMASVRVAMAGVLIASAVFAWFFFRQAAYGITTRHEVAMIIGLTVPLIALGDLTGRIAQAHQWFALAFFPERTLRPVLVIAGSWLVFSLSDRSFQAEQAAWVIFFSTLTWVATQALLVQLKRRRTLGFAEAGNPMDVDDEKRAWRQASVPFFVIGLMSIGMAYGDILLLGLLSDGKETGGYFAANRLAQLVALPFYIIVGVLAPRFAEFDAAENRRQLQSLATLGAHLILWPTLGGAAVMLSFPGFFLGLFGDEFRMVQPVLVILVIGHLLNVSAGLVGTLLNMTGHQHTSAYLLGAALILNTVLNLLLIPQYGALGAGIASVVASVFWNGSAYWYVRKLLAVEPSVLSSFIRS